MSVLELVADETRRLACAPAVAVDRALEKAGLAVADIDGGFAAWKAAGAPVAQKEKKA